MGAGMGMMLPQMMKDAMQSDDRAQPQGGESPEAESQAAAGFCSNCGGALPEGAKFCPSCGTQTAG